jgi:pyruvate/2-oxoglutarate dehydrogenase complex dihydrolipoamide acyltransferase (E2) component
MSGAEEVRVPFLNVNDESVVLLGWRIGDGEHVTEGQALADVETSKATVEIPAPATGYVRHNFAPGAEIPTGAVLCFIASQADDLAPPGLHVVPHSAPAESVRAGSVTAAVVGDRSTALDRPAVLAGGGNAAPARLAEARDTRFSHEARRLALERGFDERHFRGAGLVRAEDVRKLSETLTRPATPPAGNGTTSTSASQSGVARSAPSLRKNLPPSKRHEIKLLSAGAAGLRSCVTVACRTRGLRSLATGPSDSLVVPALLIHESARLLRVFPEFNAFYEEGAGNYYQEVNVGYALNAGYGLKVPVVRRADQKGLPEISAELGELLVSYLAESLTSEQLSGGTFTVSDLHREDVLTVDPLIIGGQSAILAVGGENAPVGSEEASFNLVLAFDHRLSDGRAAVRFLTTLRERLAAYETVIVAAAVRDDAERQPCCAQCLRGVTQLHSEGAHLLQSVSAEGGTRLVCSVCLSGW